MLCWILTNGPAAIVCEIEANPDQSFDLRLMPLSVPLPGFVEHYDTATAALERHAAIASQLRQAGWLSTDHLTANRFAS